MISFSKKAADLPVFFHKKPAIMFHIANISAYIKCYNVM